MLFRRLIFGLLTVSLGLAALAFGLLFVICLSLFFLWHGLSVSVIIFGTLMVGCVVLAHKALKHTRARSKITLPSANRR